VADVVEDDKEEVEEVEQAEVEDTVAAAETERMSASGTGVLSRSANESRIKSTTLVAGSACGKQPFTIKAPALEPPLDEARELLACCSNDTRSESSNSAIVSCCDDLASLGSLGCRSGCECDCCR